MVHFHRQYEDTLQFTPVYTYIYENKCLHVTYSIILKREDILTELQKVMKSATHYNESKHNHHHGLFFINHAKRKKLE